MNPPNLVRVAGILWVLAHLSLWTDWTARSLGQPPTVTVQLVPVALQVPARHDVSREYVWQLLRDGPCRLSTNFLVFEVGSPTPRRMGGGVHGSDGESACEIRLAVSQEGDGSIKLLGSTTRDDSVAAFSMEMPEPGVGLADQRSQFRSATLHVGESRVLWEGWVAKGTAYVKHVRFIVGLLPEGDQAEQPTPDSPQAIRLNSRLDVRDSDLVGQWLGVEGNQGPMWGIDFKADGSYERREMTPTGGPLAVAEGIVIEGTERHGTWRLSSNTISLRESSGTDDNWEIVDFWIADMRIGNQHLTLKHSDGREVQLQCILGDMRTGLQDREQIGTAMGKPVYRDQIRPVGFQLRGELFRLFSAPALDAYRKANLQHITPTPQELKTATAYFTQAARERMSGEYGDSLRTILAEATRQLASSDLSEDQRKQLQAKKQTMERMLAPTDEQQAMVASWTLHHWKFQRSFYDQFGGGRILWQQAGVEAFDAMHEFVRQHESAGDFKITDSSLRSELYEYWTNEESHGSFLTNDQERIRSTFLQPPWLEMP